MMSFTSDVRADNYRLNLDHVVSRLTSYTKNFIATGALFEEPPFGMDGYSYVCKFRKDSRCDLLAVGTGGGHVALYDTSDEASESMVASINVADDMFISDICWLPDKCQLIACLKGCATLFDMCQLQLLSIFNSHTPSIATVDVCYEQSAIFASGTELDGCVTVWDTREKINRQLRRLLTSLEREALWPCETLPLAVFRQNLKYAEAEEFSSTQG